MLVMDRLEQLYGRVPLRVEDLQMPGAVPGFQGSVSVERLAHCLIHTDGWPIRCPANSLAPTRPWYCSWPLGTRSLFNAAAWTPWPGERDPLLIPYLHHRLEHPDGAPG